MSYEPIKCSFCNKEDDQTINFYKTNVTANYICDQCISTLSLAKDKVHEIKSHTAKHSHKNNASSHNNSTMGLSTKNLPSPNDVFNFLSKNIIGQDEAKKTISIAVAHHYRRLIDPSIGKSNILLIGPTGTGKTELARTISTYLDVPFATADATNFTSKGYVGEDIETIIQRLLINAQWDVEKASQGIVFIDEIDKIVKRGHGSDSSSVNTTAVQQELLRILEGDNIKINKASANSPTGFEAVYINTKNILFICAGAFVGLQDLVQKQKSRPMGLVAEKTTEEAQDFWGDLLESKHLKQFGMIPELLGRLPVYAITKPLTKDDLLNIISVPENSISKQYTKLFSIDNVDVEFSKEFYDTVADEAISSDLGARGIRVIFEKKMKDTFFNIHNYKGKAVLIRGSGEVSDKSPIS